MPVGLHLADRDRAARPRLRHPARGARVPRRLLLRRHVARTGTDPRGQRAGDAALPGAYSRLDRASRRPDAEAHSAARPGAYGVLSPLPVSRGRPHAGATPAVVVARRVPAYVRASRDFADARDRCTPFALDRK